MMPEDVVRGAALVYSKVRVRANTPFLLIAVVMDLLDERRIVVRRRRRSRVEAERLVLEFERSGLSRRAFCAQHGLSVPSLDQYRKRCRDVISSSPGRRLWRTGFFRWSLSSLGHCGGELAVIAVELANGRRIEVAPGFDGSTLERLVAVLEKA